MSMLDRRLQVLIDEQRWERLASESDRRGVSVAVLVREAIDQRFPSDPDERRAALDAVLAAPPMPVPDPIELREELDQLRGRKG